MVDDADKTSAAGNDDGGEAGGEDTSAKEERYRPRLLAFLCNWCSYAGADLAGVGRIQMQPFTRNIRVMCSSRVNPVFILRAYLTGADGVLVAGCHPGDCHYQAGNYHTRRRFAYFKKILETVGMDDERIRLSWISASEGPRYGAVIDDFSKKIEALGPNEARHEMFL